MDFLPDLAAKSTLLLTAAFLSLFFFRRAPAGIRHWIISWAMTALLVLPFLILLLPGLPVSILPDVRTAKPKMQQVAVSANAGRAMRGKHLPATAAQATVISKLQVEMELTSGGRPFYYLPFDNKLVSDFNLPMHAPLLEEMPKAAGGGRLPWLLIVWLSGSGWMLVRICRGLFQLRQLKKQATPVLLPYLAGDLLPGRVLIGDHPGVQTPMTWGIFTPVILLPHTVRNCSAAELEMILLHERMHIRRSDFLLHLIAMFTAGLYWFHPLVWILKKRQVLEREKACDEAVISSGIRPVDYAEKLLAIARKLLPPSTKGLEMAVHMAQASQIKQRIVAILEKPAGAGAISTGRKWFPIGVLLLAAPLLAAVEPVIRDFPVLSHLPFIAADETRNDQSSTEIASPEHDRLTPTPATHKPEAGILPQDPELPVLADRDVLPALPAQLLLVVSSQQKPTLNFQPRRIDLPRGWYGQWQIGRSTFRVWTRGSFRILPVMPYVETETADDLVIIEEQKGSKTYRLVITRAAYDGSLVQSFRQGQPNSWSDIKQGEALHLWTINDEWMFLGKGRDDWMRQNMELIAQKLEQTGAAVRQPADPEDGQWKELIATQEAFIKKRFIPGSALPVWNDQAGKMEPPVVAPAREPFDLSRMPYLPTPKDQAVSGSGRKIIGFETAARTTTGWSGGSNRIGMRYATLIHTKALNGKMANFNFHLQNNMCSGADLKLHLYAVQDGLPAYRLLEQPIIIHAGDETGWIQTDLRAYDVAPSEAMLVVLELVDYQPRRGKAGLFFSHAPDGNKHRGLLSMAYSWDFVLAPLAVNFTLE